MFLQDPVHDMGLHQLKGVQALQVVQGIAVHEVYLLELVSHLQGVELPVQHALGLSHDNLRETLGA